MYLVITTLKFDQFFLEFWMSTEKMPNFSLRIIHSHLFSVMQFCSNNDFPQYEDVASFLEEIEELVTQTDNPEVLEPLIQRIMDEAYSAHGDMEYVIPHLENMMKVVERLM